MADDATLLPSTGYVYTAPVGTPMPTLPIMDPLAPGTPWVSIGNTSLENGISREVEGDDPEVLGTWQNPQLRTTRPTRTRSVTMNLNDFTVETFKYYYGGGKVVGPDGVTPADSEDTVRALQIPVQPEPQEAALMIIAVDGDYQVVEYFPHASILGDDAAEYDATSLAEMPVRATMLAESGTDYTGVISERLQFRNL